MADLAAYYAQHGKEGTAELPQARTRTQRASR
jgi:hypothetical protein